MTLTPPPLPEKPTIAGALVDALMHVQVAIFIAAVSAALRTWQVTLLWSWFVVTTTDFAELSYLTAMGIVFLNGLLKRISNKEIDSDTRPPGQMSRVLKRFAMRETGLAFYVGFAYAAQALLF